MKERAEEDAAHVERLWDLAMARFGLSRHAGLVPASNVPQATPGIGRVGPRNKSGVTTGWVLGGAPDPRYHGNLNVRREGLDVARLMSDLRDIAFSAGSACASGSGRASHVLRAIGLSEAEARASIRIGFGRYTTEDELADALDRIAAAADAQRIAA
jgi:cysteine desulfurase